MVNFIPIFQCQHVIVSVPIYTYFPWSLLYVWTRNDLFEDTYFIRTWRQQLLLQVTYEKLEQLKVNKGRMLDVNKTRKPRGIWRVRKRLPALALQRATSDHVQWFMLLGERAETFLWPLDLGHPRFSTLCGCGHWSLYRRPMNNSLSAVFAHCYNSWFILPPTCYRYLSPRPVSLRCSLRSCLSTVNTTFCWRHLFLTSEKRDQNVRRKWAKKAVRSKWGWFSNNLSYKFASFGSTARHYYNNIQTDIVLNFDNDLKTNNYV